MSVVYYKVSAEGYKRGPYRLTRDQAALDRPLRSGSVVACDASRMLDERRIPWHLVDAVFSADGVDGITLVYGRALKSNDWNLVCRAATALEFRWRTPPDPHT